MKDHNGNRITEQYKERLLTDAEYQLVLKERYFLNHKKEYLTANVGFILLLLAAAMLGFIVKPVGWFFPSILLVLLWVPLYQTIRLTKKQAKYVKEILSKGF